VSLGVMPVMLSVDIEQAACYCARKAVHTCLEWVALRHSLVTGDIIAEVIEQKLKSK